MKSIVTFLLAFIALITTSEMLPLTWDEGETIDRAQKIATWFHDAKPLSRESIREHWIFTTQIEGHPAGYGIVIAAGHAATKSFLPPKTAYRFGPMFLFAAAAAAVFWRIEKTISAKAAYATVAAMLLIPRLFTHVHIAACDSTLTACWLLTWALFDLKTVRRTLPWGIILGLTLSAKFTGWVAIVPFFLSVFVLKDETPLSKRLLRFANGLGVALLTFFVLNPPLWFDPLHGFIQFFTLNTNRNNFNISVLFLDRMYNLDHPLPWYNTIVWTAITIPLGFLMLLFYGIGNALFRGKDSRRLQTVVVVSLHALSLLIVRAIPGTPPHDGVRLFITTFAFLAILVGIGADAFWSVHFRRIRIGLCAIVLIYGIGVFNLYWYAPQWLSYYNAAIGGLSGAAKAGMEPTYYWDSLDREVADWLDEHTKPDELVLFCASSTKTLLLQKNWGELRTHFYRKGAKDQQGKKIRYYVLQRRPSGEFPVDKRLIQQAKPVYVKVIHRGGWGVWNLDDVPILEIYEFADYHKARQGVQRSKH